MQDAQKQEKAEPLPPQRMFPKLAAFGADELKRGSGDFLTALARELVLSPADDLADKSEYEHPDLPAGYTYFGQLITHDITFLAGGDPPRSELLRARPKWSNLRTPRLDLDCMYGGGPRISPELYGRWDPDSFVLGRGHTLDAKKPGDLQRTRVGRAIIADARNDENPMISQMHLAFLRVHNACVRALRARGEAEPFREAQRLVRWTYQWLVVHDFLRRILHDKVKGEPEAAFRCLDSGAQPTCRIFDARTEPFLPLEFAHAAFRFGHSLVRSSYVLNGSLPPIALTPNDWRAPEHSYLALFRPLPAGWEVDWQLFFDARSKPHLSFPELPAKYANDPRRRPQKARRIDDKLSERLAHIRTGVGPLATQSLAHMTLLRGRDASLPAGGLVAQALEYTPFTKDNLPLWVYILREAKSQTNGLRLGECGSSIVLNVLLFLLLADRESYLSVDPTWKPPFARDGQKFELLDFLMLANGVDPDLLAPATPAQSAS